MSNRAFFIFAGLFLLLVIGQLAILVHQRHQATVASIACRATNAGVPLAAHDGRVYVYGTQTPGELVAEGDLGQSLSVPPGHYDVRVFFLRSADKQFLWLRDILLAKGERIVRQVEFSAGELSVEVTIGTEKAESGQAVVYVFPPEDHNRIITSMASGGGALLAAGAYDLRVVLVIESLEKEVRWLRDVPVTTGLHTKRAVHFHRGTLQIKARNAGKELTPPAVTLTVYRAGDIQEGVFDSGLAGVPLGLPVGSYDVKASFTDSHDKPVRWLRGLEVKDNRTTDMEVEFASGTVILKAEIENGGPVDDFQAYTYYYRAGDHERPVAYTPAGEPVILEHGRYDLRVHFFRSHDQPDIWLHNLVVEAGQTVTRTVAFASGKLLVRAYDGAGNELRGDDVFLYVYAAGERSRSIISARCGEVLILTEGRYDIRAADTRSPSRQIWLEDLELTTGRLLEKAVTFNGRDDSENGGGKKP